MKKEDYLKVEKLVIDAVSTPGIWFDHDVLSHVNKHSPVPVNMATVEFILEKWFAEDIGSPSYH